MSNPLVLGYPKGAVEKVQLFFVENVEKQLIFYKVVILFRVAHNEAMELLWHKISESYGTSVEEEAAAETGADRQARSEAIRKEKNNPAYCTEIKDKNHDIKDFVCQECGFIATDKLPRQKTFSWDGDVTKGSVFIKLTEDKIAYEMFSLTKENPEIRVRIEEEIKKENIRKAEEERKRREEEYKAPLKL